MVPITRLDRILTEVAAVRNLERDTTEIVESVRMMIHEDLPGNGDSRMLIDLPEATEESIADGIRRENGKVFFCLEPERVQEFLSQVRNILAEDQVIGPVLVVSSAELRPLVRGITALEFPNMPVLARRELISGVDKE